MSRPRSAITFPLICHVSSFKTSDYIIVIYENLRKVKKYLLSASIYWKNESIDKTEFNNI